MTWLTVDTEKDPLQCEFVFGGYHNFASENTFACGPNHFCMSYTQKMLSLSIVSKLNTIMFSLRILDFCK